MGCWAVSAARNPHTGEIHFPVIEADDTTCDGLLSRKDVLDEFDISGTDLDRLVKWGAFAHPRSLPGGVIRYRRCDVVAWEGVQRHAVYVMRERRSRWR